MCVYILCSVRYPAWMLSPAWGWPLGVIMLESAVVRDVRRWRFGLRTSIMPAGESLDGTTHKKK